MLYMLTALISKISSKQIKLFKFSFFGGLSVIIMRSLQTIKIR